MIKRVEILVYFNYRSDTKKYLESTGATVQYLNKKMGYAVLYADEKNLGRTISQIKRLHGFKKYEVSQDELVSFSIDEVKEEKIEEVKEEETIDQSETFEKDM